MKKSQAASAYGRKLIERSALDVGKGRRGKPGGFPLLSPRHTRRSQRGGGRGVPGRRGRAEGERSFRVHHFLEELVEEEDERGGDLEAGGGVQDRNRPGRREHSLRPELHDILEVRRARDQRGDSDGGV